MKSSTVLIIVLSAIAVLAVGFLVFALVSNAGGAPEATTTAATEVTETTAAAETTVPEETTAVTTAPQAEEFTLTFAGDCTFAMSGFDAAVAGDYTYPFRMVQDYFGTDDCTFVNLECALSDRGAKADKLFTFRGDPEYVNILTEGSVEFASLVNNHSMDFGQVAYDDTKSLLEEAGVHYGENKMTTFIELDRGLKIGVLSLYFPQTTDGIATAIKGLREQGAHIVVVCVHWGEEYHFKPNDVQVNVGRYAIDNGADIVYGQHPHVLQPIEEYNGGIIFYSLANFSFGGNPYPGDLDTAIVRQKVVLQPDGTASLAELEAIPCFVTSTGTAANNYQPLPMDPETDAEAYERVLRKLNGEFELDKLHVSYRDDLNNPGGSTDATTPEGGTEATTPPAGGEGGTDVPPAGGDTPPSGGDTPPSGGDTPPVGGDSSSSGGETPPPVQNDPAPGTEG